MKWIQLTFHGVKSMAETTAKATTTAAPMPQSSLKKEFLCLAEVCELLGRKKSTIRLWRHKRNFPAPISVSTRTTLYKRQEILDWLRKQEFNAEIKEATA